MLSQVIYGERHNLGTGSPKATRLRKRRKSMTALSEETCLTGKDSTARAMPGAGSTPSKPLALASQKQQPHQLSTLGTGAEVEGAPATAKS